MKYRKKPVVIEAVKWTGENVKEIATFMGIESIPYDLNTHDLSIMTLEGGNGSQIFLRRHTKKRRNKNVRKSKTIGITRIFTLIRP